MFVSTRQKKRFEQWKQIEISFITKNERKFNTSLNLNMCMFYLISGFIKKEKKKKRNEKSK